MKSFVLNFKSSNFFKLIKAILIRKKAGGVCDEYKKTFTKHMANIWFDRSTLRQKLLIEAHIVEKGLSHNQIKPGFGRKNIISIVKHLSEIEKTLGSDCNYEIEYATHLIEAYHMTNVRLGYDDSDFVPEKYMRETPNTECEFGVKKYNPLNVFSQVKNMNFFDFANSRSSCRIYDCKCKPINKDLLISCAKLAQTAPSACNRQANKIYVVTDPAKFDAIEKIQRGCKGFGTNASAFVFITSDINLYQISEERLPVFDSGIFTMNMVYAMHYYGLFSCVLNASFHGSDNITLKTMLQVPDNEMITGLIEVYDLHDTELIKVPLALRRDVQDIISFVESSK